MRKRWGQSIAFSNCCARPLSKLGRLKEVKFGYYRVFKDRYKRLERGKYRWSEVYKTNSLDDLETFVKEEL